jgi:hypothetical protein
MRQVLFFPLCLILLTSACGPSRNTSESANNAAVDSPAVNSVPPTTPDQPKEQVSTDVNKLRACRVMVTFISIGEGTDREAKGNLDRVTSPYLEKGKLEMETIPWGREGEVDYCFMLNNLSGAEQQKFISDLKNTFNGNKLVQIVENEPSMHRR